MLTHTESITRICPCPYFSDILEKDYDLLDNELTFQHDGASPHFDVQVRQFSNERIGKCDGLTIEV